VRERGLEKNVHLIGFVEDAPKYLSAFDLFVHASQSEAIGLVILEAGMAGLPTVATRVGGIPEVIESGVHGLLVPVHSPQKLAQAMLQIIENPKEAQCLGSSLKKRVENEFSTERMVQETLALY
jgi:glycosyltransferase involved in cell wall biosynthesis